jgi:hypothetical protein
MLIVVSRSIRTRGPFKTLYDYTKLTHSPLFSPIPLSAILSRPGYEQYLPVFLRFPHLAKTFCVRNTSFLKPRDSELATAETELNFAALSICSLHECYHNCLFSHLYQE